MNKKETSRGIKYDGKSRVSNDLYRKNWNEIFKKGIVGKDVTLKETNLKHLLIQLYYLKIIKK